MVTGKVSSPVSYLQEYTRTDLASDVLAIVTIVPLALLLFLSTV
jgi:hypothetical protein